MDKLSRLKQGVFASSLMACVFVCFGAGWRMATHEEILVMLWEIFPIYFIALLTRYAKRAIRELENQYSPSGGSDSPDSLPPADEPATDE